ncbi:hypothetical protein BV25DRAFT_1917416 [Artomyces pyxidatus]|uniref:Uncharacterized protein n=1 Tax=Artomyces pyxidatus TaxID=48021 RepID=A0ACB8SYD6_9AGAM|nr:hypothetical protein BV25DRAFT_1917416 [Artomyces pyxidatus]
MHPHCASWQECPPESWVRSDPLVATQWKVVNATNPFLDEFEISRAAFLLRGQSGSGKALWMFYVLALRSQVKRTTIFQTAPGYYYVFDKERAWKVHEGIRHGALDLFVDTKAWVNRKLHDAPDHRDPEVIDENCNRALQPYCVSEAQLAQFFNEFGPPTCIASAGSITHCRHTIQAALAAATLEAAYYAVQSASGPTPDAFVYDAKKMCATVFRATAASTEYTVPSDTFAWLRQLGVERFRFVAVTAPGVALDCVFSPELDALVGDEKWQLVIEKFER